MIFNRDPLLASLPIFRFSLLLPFWLICLLFISIDWWWDCMCHAAFSLFHSLIHSQILPSLGVRMCVCIIFVSVCISFSIHFHHSHKHLRIANSINGTVYLLLLLFLLFCSVLFIPFLFLLCNASTTQYIAEQEAQKYMSNQLRFEKYAIWSCVFFSSLRFL